MGVPHSISSPAVSDPLIAHAISVRLVALPLLPVDLWVADAVAGEVEAGLGHSLAARPWIGGGATANLRAMPADQPLKVIVMSLLLVLPMLVDFTRPWAPGNLPVPPVSGTTTVGIMKRIRVYKNPVSMRGFVAIPLPGFEPDSPSLRSMGIECLQAFQGVSEGFVCKNWSAIGPRSERVVDQFGLALAGHVVGVDLGRADVLVTHPFLEGAEADFPEAAMVVPNVCRRSCTLILRTSARTRAAW